MQRLRSLSARRLLTALAVLIASLLVPAALAAQSWQQLTAAAQHLPFDGANQVASAAVSDGQAVIAFHVEGSGPHTLEVIVTRILRGLENEDDDSVLYVFDEYGYLLGENDDGPYGYASLLSGVDLPDPGTYYAIVTTYPRFIEIDDNGYYLGFGEPGLSSIEFDLVIEFGDRDIDWSGLHDDYDFAYEIVFDEFDVYAMARAVRLAKGSAAIDGNLDETIAVYALEVDGPTDLDAEVVIRGSEFADSLLTVIDEYGFVIAVDDDGGVEYASRIEGLYLPGAGRYYLVVSSYPNYPQTDEYEHLLGFSDAVEEFFEFTLEISVAPAGRP